MDPHHGVPILFTEADKHAVTQNPGVVYQHVDLAKRGQRGVDDALRRGHSGDVVSVGDGLPAALTDFSGHLFGGVVTNVIDHHIRAFLRERQRIGAPQTTARPRDDHGSSFTNRHLAAPKDAQ